MQQRNYKKMTSPAKVGPSMERTDSPRSATDYDVYCNCKGYAINIQNYTLVILFIFC